jgi:hypothetical protein
VGPRGRHAARSQGRPRARRGQRGDDPRPRPVLRDAPGRPAGRRARRGDGLRGAPGPGLPARRVELADRGDRPRPRHRDARPPAPRAPCRSGAGTPSGARRSSVRPSASSRARPST